MAMSLFWKPMPAPFIRALPGHYEPSQHLLNTADVLSIRQQPDQNMNMTNQPFDTPFSQMAFHKPTSRARQQKEATSSSHSKRHELRDTNFMMEPKYTHDDSSEAFLQLQRNGFVSIPRTDLGTAFAPMNRLPPYDHFVDFRGQSTGERDEMDETMAPIPSTSNFNPVDQTYDELEHYAHRPFDGGQEQFEDTFVRYSAGLEVTPPMLLGYDTAVDGKAASLVGSYYAETNGCLDQTNWNHTQTQDVDLHHGLPHLYDHPWAASPETFSSAESTGSYLNQDVASPWPAPVERENTEPFLSSNGSERGRQDELLLRYRQDGKSYKEIQSLGGFEQSVSTLRGRYRNLVKAKSARVRKPQWTDTDVSINDVGRLSMHPR